MGITVGIDVGGSTTKIVGIADNELRTPLLVKANDPVASLFGAFGRFVSDNGLELSQIERIMVTGVGASFIDKPMYGIPTAKVEEFMANGLGGLYLSGLSRAVVISMGTGTSLVKASAERIEHIGGTGIGGGTILGLSNKMLNIRDIDLVIKTAEEGNLHNIDLMVGDITSALLPGLPPHATASNFGKISDVASHGDVALGILNLVFQAIAMTAVFAVKNTDMNNIVLIGILSAIPRCNELMGFVKDLYDINYTIPEHSEYATALGAALAYVQGREFTEI